MIDLVQYIAVICPQQKIDRATAIPWYDVIGHLEFGAARNAVAAVKHYQAFVDTSDIIREVKRAASAKPYERTAAEAIAASNRRELEAAPAVPPNAEYLQALDDLKAKMRQRNEDAYLAGRDAQRKADAWIDGALNGRLPREIPYDGTPAPRWRQLPGDPPELRNWLARCAARETAA